MCKYISLLNFEEFKGMYVYLYYYYHHLRSIYFLTSNNSCFYNPRYPVVTLNDNSRDIRVKRYGGTLKAVTVLYQTLSLINPVYIGDIVMAPARENQDFTPTAGQLSFPIGSVSSKLHFDCSLTTSHCFFQICIIWCNACMLI